MVASVSTQYIHQNVVKCRYPIQTLDMLLGELEPFLRGIESIQSLSTILNITCMVYNSYYSLMTKETKNSFFAVMLSFLEHPNASIRGLVQECLVTTFMLMRKESREGVFRKMKQVLDVSESEMC